MSLRGELRVVPHVPQAFQELVAEEALTADIAALASRSGRYGRRRVSSLCRTAGRAVDVKRLGGSGGGTGEDQERPPPSVSPTQHPSPSCAKTETGPPDWGGPISEAT